jgi:hypothetical protein
MSTVANVASKVASIADPTLSSAFGALGSAGSMAAQVFQSPSGGPVDTVTQPAQQLAASMVRQQGATETWIHTMASILVDDYGKLTAVGSGIGAGGEWTWSDNTTVGSIQALSGSTRAAAYTALVPAAWGGYNVKAGIGQPPGAAADVNITCDQPANYPGHYHTFAAANPENVFHAATYMGTSGSVSYEFWTLAQLVDFPWTPNRDAYATMPSTSVTDFIYGKDSTGASGAFAYAPAWWRSTFNAPGHVSCGYGSGSLPVDEVWSQHYEPPVVTPPLP